MGTVTDKDEVPKEPEVKQSAGERIYSTLSTPVSPVLQSLAIVLVARLAGADPWLLFGAAVIVYTGKLTNWTINIRRR